MSSRTLTTWLLIAGPIVAIVGFGGWGTVVGFDLDSSDSQAVITALAGNIDGVKPFAMLATLGYLSIVAGLAGVKSSMDGGSGHSIAGVGVLLLVIGSAGAAIETPNGSDIANALPSSPIVITPDTSPGIPWRGAMVYFNDLEGKITKINLTNSTKNGADLFSQTTLFNLGANTINKRYSYFR